VRKVVWTVAARGNLRGIDRWLEREATPAIAIAALATIRARSHFLVDFPHGRRPLKDGTRILRVLGTAYPIRHQISDDAITMLRVHHEREDWAVDP
jgi:toxin ParE1/3/4